MTKKLFRVAVDAAADAADDIKRPIQMVVEAASDKKAKEAALTAISQNAETSARTKGKVVVDVEEFNKQPVTEKFQVASPQEVRKVTAAAAGKKSGEMGEAIIQPHKLTVDDVEYDLPAFDPKDPKYQVMGMRPAQGEDLFRLGEVRLNEQNMTILPNWAEKALSNDANPKMRTLGRFLGISDDMDGWANKGNWLTRGINTTKTNLLPAAGLEMLTSKLYSENDGQSDEYRGGLLTGDGWLGRATAATLEKAGLKDSKTDKASEKQSAMDRLATKSEADKPFEVVRRISPAGKFSRPAQDFNNQRIAAAVGDKTPNGLLAHRTFAESVRPFWKSAQGDNDDEKVASATRMMFERMSPDQIVESLLFGSQTAEKRLHAEQSAEAMRNGGNPQELKPMAQAGFAKFLSSVEADDPKTPYITFPSSMTSTFVNGESRTGFRVKRDLGDNVTEEVYVVPVIVPKKTNAQQKAGLNSGKKGDLDTPTLGQKMAEGRYEIIYINANPRGPKDTAIPSNQIIWDK